MLLYTKLAQPKAPKKRSRAGCNFCKEKKKKCDETRPSCGRCAEHRQDCVYEPIRPRQRRKREGTISIDTTAADTPQSVFSLDSSIQPTPAPQQQQPSPLLSSSGGLSIQQWDQQQRWRAAGGDSAAAVRAGNMMDGAELNATVVMPTHIQIPPPLNMTDDAMSLVESLFTPWTPATDSVVFSPLTPSPFDFSSALPPPTALTPTSISLDDDPDIEEIVRRDSCASNSLALTAAAAAAEPSPHLEFCLPAFAEFSPHKNRRALVGHFCNVLSHLIVFREENGNPFQQLVLPLSRTSNAVMDAIYALASAHLEFRGVSVGGEKSEYFHGKAIQELARLIEKRGPKDRNELLAAIMLLVYYEVLVQRGRSNIVDGHLKGAMTIMENQEASTDPTGVFLERAFRFYDVIAALSFGTAPLSSAPGRGSLSPLPPLDSRGATSSSGSVDTLLGLATSLWPIIHRLSNLSSVKEDLVQAMNQGLMSKVAVLRTELESTAAAILAALQQWQPVVDHDTLPHAYQDDDVAKSARIQSILNNALAYRHSAFVYLYRVIHDYPRSHTLVQHHAHLSLEHCVGTVSHEGPMGALLWPLFVAACEATSSIDRQLARQAFVAIDRRQGMANIERAWCIVQEVWCRADALDLQTMLRQNNREAEGTIAVSEEAAVADLLPATTPVVEEITDGPTPTTTPAERGPAARRRESLMRDACVVQLRQGGRGVGGDLWRRVSREMGVNIVFG